MLAHILLIVILQNMNDVLGWIWIIAFLVATMFLFIVLNLLRIQTSDTDIYVKKMINEIDFSSGEKTGGGMAEIYICDDPWNPGQKVVVKFPKRSKKEKEQFTIDYRFENEIKHHQKLQHPNIVPFLEHGKCKHPFLGQETPYLIQHFIDGCTLRKMIHPDQSPLSKSIIFEVTTQILDALEYVNSQGVIHRDLSWNNIMVDTTGRLYLIDFGNSTILDGQQTKIDRKNSSQPIYPVEPPHPFKAPDNLENMPNTRARDFYALAILVYLMYGGSSPHNNRPDKVREEVKTNLEKMLNVPYDVKETLKDCFEGNSGTVLELRTSLRPLRHELGEMVQNIVNPDRQAPPESHFNENTTKSSLK